MPRKLTTEQFIEKSNAIHGNKYNYDNVIYNDNITGVKIICNIHGEFIQRPHDHLNGKGCTLCGVIRRTNAQLKPLEEFIEQANRKHNSKYDYSKSIYTGANNRLTIICPHHGEFRQNPNLHINRGSNC